MKDNRSSIDSIGGMFDKSPQFQNPGASQPVNNKYYGRNSNNSIDAGLPFSNSTINLSTGKRRTAKFTNHLPTDHPER